MQDRKPLAFIGKNSIQLKIGIQPLREMLLSAIETSNEYKNILLCYPIIVFTDHRINTFNELKASDRILRCLLLLEENGVTFEYLP
jgi:hypothetical protein